MSAPGAAASRFGALHWLWLTAVVVALDQLTKLAITASFEEFESLTLLPVLDLMRLHNEGAAFSLLSTASGWQRWFFLAVGIGVSAAIIAWLKSLPARGQAVCAAGLALVLGGALGNVIDRARLGHVVDFIRVHYGDSYFPAFNAADSAITLGAALLIFDTLFRQRRPTSTGRSRPEPPSARPRS